MLSLINGQWNGLKGELMIFNDSLITVLNTLTDDKLLEIRAKVISECPLSTDDKRRFTELIDKIVGNARFEVGNAQLIGDLKVK
jgi:hypothetical protein